MSTGHDDLVHAAHLADLRHRAVHLDGAGLRLGDTYVMFHIEAELMALHADALVGDHRGATVLEVGLGLGVFATQLACYRPGAYTAVEPHPGVVAQIGPTVRQRLGCPVTIHAEPWQRLAFPAGHFDAIMYDTWPPDGHAEADFAAFVEHVALPSLRPGGRFSFFHSGPRLSDARAAVLERHFATWFTVPYALPPEARPAAWTKPTLDFLIPVARKDTP